MAATKINKEGNFTLIWLVAFQGSFRCFDVAVQFFEEILLEKKWKELIKHIECSDVLVEWE